MENASKALIIAGAILISIVLIAVGVMVVSAANAPVETAGSKMSDIDKQIFNRDYTAYIGDKKSGSKVVSLLQAIQANNSNEETKAEIKVSYDTEQGKTGANDIATIINKIKSGKYYKVEANYEDGIIDTITITLLSNSTNPGN